MKITCQSNPLSWLWYFTWQKGDYPGWVWPNQVNLLKAKFLQLLTPEEEVREVCSKWPGRKQIPILCTADWGGNGGRGSIAENWRQPLRTAPRHQPANKETGTWILQPQGLLISVVRRLNKLRRESWVSDEWAALTNHLISVMWDPEHRIHQEVKDTRPTPTVR